MLRTEFVIKTVLEALETLCRQTDLTPHNEIINQTLSHLVETLAATYERTEEEIILSDPRVRAARPRLLEKLSQAEAEMEKYWADRFLAHDDLDVEDLKEFWYWDNYEQLVDMEMDCLPDAKENLSWIHSCQAKGKDGAAFIGSGALPLSAIILHLKTGMKVTCIDSDPEACEKSAKLLDKLGLTGMDVICADGEDMTYDQFSTIFVASLIPNDAKENIVKRAREGSTETFIAIRSAERLHTLLYEPIDEDREILTDCRLVSRTKHDAEVINTTLVYHSDPLQNFRPAQENAKKAETLFRQARIG